MENSGEKSKDKKRSTSQDSGASFGSSFSSQPGTPKSDGKAKPQRPQTPLQVQPPQVQGARSSSPKGYVPNNTWSTCKFGASCQNAMCYRWHPVPIQGGKGKGNNGGYGKSEKGKGKGNGGKGALLSGGRGNPQQCVVNPPKGFSSPTVAPPLIV